MALLHYVAAQPVETLAEAQEIAAQRLAEDAVVPGQPQFFELTTISGKPFLPFAVMPDGEVREAARIGVHRALAVI